MLRYEFLDTRTWSADAKRLIKPAFHIHPDKTRPPPLKKKQRQNIVFKGTPHTIYALRYDIQMSFVTIRAYITEQLDYLVINKHSNMNSLLITGLKS